MQRVILTAAASATAIVLFASACGSGSDDGTDASSASSAPPAEVEAEPTRPDTSTTATAPVEANGETVEVVALDNTFRPERIEVVAGTAIRWENRGRNDHDVVPADATLTWGVDAAGFAPGDEYTLLFDTPGDYPYFCSIHGTKDVGMIGTVVVTAAGA